MSKVTRNYEQIMQFRTDQVDSSRCEMLEKGTHRTRKRSVNLAETGVQGRLWKTAKQVASRISVVLQGVRTMESNCISLGADQEVC